MQQVQGAGKRIGMQAVSRVGEPVALGEDQIFSDKHPSGMLLLPPNIRLAHRKKGDRDLLRDACVRGRAPAGVWTNMHCVLIFRAQGLTLSVSLEDTHLAGCFYPLG